MPLNRQWPASAKVANSAAINTVETYISAVFPLPANTLAVGSVFRITVYGTCTSTAANLSTFTIRLGTAGTVADTAVLAATCTAAASGINIAFKVEFLVVVRTIGAGGTDVASGSIDNTGVTGIAATTNNVAGNGTTAAVNTTIANFLGVSYKSAAATTTCTFNNVVVEQVA